MTNLRIISIVVIDSRTLEIQFTEELDSNISISNLKLSTISNVTQPTILNTEVDQDILIITTTPLFARVVYDLLCFSTINQLFQSVNKSILLEDGQTNIISFLGPENVDNIIRNNLLDYWRDNIYNFDPGTLTKSLLDEQAFELVRIFHDIRQLKSDNYLEIVITDEAKLRGSGPTDRLDNEGAFLVTRVGKTLTGATTSSTLSFTFFPSYPISLQSTSIVRERLIANIKDAQGFNQLILTVVNFPVIQVSKILINYQDGSSATYPLTSGYRLKDPKFDPNFASTSNFLKNNQIELSEQVSNFFKLPKPGDIIFVDYFYQALGKTIDPSTLTVSEIFSSIREVVPPLLNRFFLNHAPIVTSTGLIASMGQISFLDPLSNPPFSKPHPAFAREIPYRLDGMPARPGEYAVEYSSGTVIVFGADSMADGSGNFPPIVSYFYQKNYTQNLDYFYNSDESSLIVSPIRELIDHPLKVSFQYQQDLVPNQDYFLQIHQEVLEEKIQNRLLNSTTIRANHFPITDVFQAINQTNGEIYKITGFEGDLIFINPRIAPQILDSLRENATFKSIIGEVLIVNSEFLNISNFRIFEIKLLNTSLVSATENLFASSFNSSLQFSRLDLFLKERYFDNQTETTIQNTDRLNVIGQYQVDYQNGIIYLAVSNLQTQDLGSVNYKIDSIVPEFSHVISVSNVYLSVGVNLISKRLTWSNFAEGEINSIPLDRSDERFDVNGQQYLNIAGTITVKDDIFFLRSIYDLFDLQNNLLPINFAPAATFSNNVISLDATGITINTSAVVSSGLQIVLPIISPAIDLIKVNFVTRISDQKNLWDNFGTVSGYTLTLSGVNSPVIGDVVIVNYQVALNGGATPIIDYSRGDLLVDYTYLADEISISYEWGDNSLEFSSARQSLNAGDTYYVSYHYGALRDGLFRNFGSVVNLKHLNVFELSLEREIYRKFLQSTFQTFPKGPTPTSIKKIVSTITKIDPDLQEAVFQGWSLGSSLLYADKLKNLGDVSFVAGKFDYGIKIENKNQAITFPIVNNLRIESGTLEMWVIPEWNGLDNDATLTFELEKNNQLLDVNNIWIGAIAYHPVLNLDNQFTVSRFDTNNIGLPATIYTNVGVFIYYDNFTNQWKILAKDSLQFSNIYSGKIFTDGSFYQTAFLPGLGEINDQLTTLKSEIIFEFNLDGYDIFSPDGYQDGYIDGYYFPSDGYVDGYSFDGISFLSDQDHYFFDFGATNNTDRFSLFKDGSGYINFEVWDKDGKPYKVSNNISSWKAGLPHHLATTWKINSKDGRDELHLFVDGFEVPNIIKYGGRPQVNAPTKFRSVQTEILSIVITRPVVVSNDISISAGSDIITSATLNFSSLGVLPGDSLIFIESALPGNFVVVSVSGQNLVINQVLNLTLDQVRISINPVTQIVGDEVDIYPEIALYLLSNGIETELPGIEADFPDYSLSKNGLNQNVLTFFGDAAIGDKLLLRAFGLNYRRCREVRFLWTPNSIFKTHLPSPINLNQVSIFSILLPRVVFDPNNTTVVGGQYQGIWFPTQPSNNVQGRTLSVRILGGNIDFSATVIVTINGSNNFGPVSESVVFTSATAKNTVNKFAAITSVTTVVTPLIIGPVSSGVEIRETYSITTSEGNNLYPVIRYSYKIQSGQTLQSTSLSSVTDVQGLFTESMIGNYLVISQPLSVVGTYTITGLIDSQTVSISPNLPTSFINGIYDVFNVSLGRSGFQNGFFILEQAGKANTPYVLPFGYYQFDYLSYLVIPFDPFSGKTLAYLGNDRNLNKPAKAIIDEMRILSTMLSDVRIGESLPTGINDSITTSFQALRPHDPFVDVNNTLMLLHFDQNLDNQINAKIRATKQYFQAEHSVNNNFGDSLASPLMVNNLGFLTTQQEGSIEFWVSPKFDTYNDPFLRYYFDAASIITENVNSLTEGTVQVSRKINKVFSVVLQNSISSFDYFAGGEILNDQKTIQLGKALPYQKTAVTVSYISTDLIGNRLSIYKDLSGFIVFEVMSNDQIFATRQPIFWSRDTWHRIFVTFKFNRKDHLDQMRLFVDGEEKGVIKFGQGYLFGQNIVFGQGFSGVTNVILTADINFTDPIQFFHIGEDYLRRHLAQARIDNLRLSDKALNPLVVGGQPVDINFNTNLNVVLPVVPNAFTTYLLDFDEILNKNDDLALLKSSLNGLFTFDLTIIDSFGIIGDDEVIKETLQILIDALKPSHTKANIIYL